jgi:RES domain-containing protein
LFGGRWNHRGTRVVYTSSSLSLAALETLAHFDEEEGPDALVAIPADMPDDVPITRIKISELASNWRTTPAPESLAEIGTRWTMARHSLVLAVPSAIIPQELNYLLNPLHPQVKRIRVGRPKPFSFDPRLWKP